MNSSSVPPSGLALAAPTGQLLHRPNNSQNNINTQ
jgi:hypothetical protein